MKKFLKKYTDEDLELALEIITKEDKVRKQEMIDSKHSIVPILLHENLKVKLEEWVKSYRGKKRPSFEIVQPKKQNTQSNKSYQNKNTNYNQKNIKPQMNVEEYIPPEKPINNPLLKPYNQEELELAVTALYTQPLADNLINIKHKISPLLTDKELKLAVMEWNHS